MRSASTVSESAVPAKTDASPFVQVRDKQFYLKGKPYAFVGVNLWYGAYLAADGLGDVARLRAELDQLASLGVTNLRILGASEDGPMQRSIHPTFRGANSNYNEILLSGLDRLLAELGERNMQAVIYLNNFWEWSGGMGTYLSWVNGGHFVDLNDPKKPWPAYPLFTMQFYANARANSLFRDYVKAVVTRTNTITGRPYEDDPAIMAWQLCNEPRPGYNADDGNHVLPAFYAWIDETAAFIKSLDANHLVSSGNEGIVGCADYEPCFVKAHESANIDYLTFHMWPKNWRWLNDQDMPGTMERTLENAAEYIERHIDYANELNKPLVLEEFGLPRDDLSFTPGTPTHQRDRFYSMVYRGIERSAGSGGPFVGSNLWGWGGRGRAARSQGEWHDGDTSYTGDPPQEPQGLNSVFDVDTSTLALISAHARALNENAAQ